MQLVFQRFLALPNLMVSHAADFRGRIPTDLGALRRRKALGKSLGRPSALSADQKRIVREKIENGETISAIARQFSTSRQTIMRVRDQA
jgi:hypothetical protein